MSKDKELKDKIQNVETELAMHGYLDGWHIRYLKLLLIKLKRKLKNR
jgi:hypothetical protein|tara:strand:- start:129 stop:269 length:141 start_codon:yes stop_codon:yes gene_type:complete